VHGCTHALVSLSQINTANIKYLIPELFGENLVRGRGLFARSCMRAQAASVIFTSVYAALVAIVNTKMPANGELVVKRLLVCLSVCLWAGGVGRSVPSGQPCGVSLIGSGGGGVDAIPARVQAQRQAGVPGNVHLPRTPRQPARRA
jgi:hypothetical protein